MASGYKQLSDEELRRQLQRCGINVGPITDTTRHLYLSKLRKCTGGDFTTRTQTNTATGYKQHMKLMPDDELRRQLQSYGVNVGPVTDTTRQLYQAKLKRMGSVGSVTVTQSNIATGFKQPAVHQTSSTSVHNPPVQVMYTRIAGQYPPYTAARSRDTHCHPTQRGVTHAHQVPFIFPQVPVGQSSSHALATNTDGSNHIHHQGPVESLKTHSLTLPIQLSQSLELELQSIACRHQLGLQVNVNHLNASRTIQMKGVASKVSRAVTELQQAIINYQARFSETQESFPPWWQPQVKKIQVFPVQKGSQEWSHVEGKFRASMSETSIAQIDRIQNTWLWKKYLHHKKMMAEKNSEAVNEMELFHGTRRNDPRKILYDCQEGFDMRFSSQGMWGQATYFAVNARYSDSFAHTNTNGQKEIFLAKVLTGDSCLSDPDSSLRMPPLKPSTEGEQLRVRYDTVAGFTGGFQVYMTYDNQKAYPAYLITY